VSYAQLVGGELARLRAHSGRSCADVARSVNLADPETLARYQNGDDAADLTVLTFAEICRTLGVVPSAVLARVDALDDAVVVDLGMVATSGDPDLRVLRRWAERCLSSSGDASILAVPVRVVAALARSHGVDPVTVVSALGACVPVHLLGP
jgi:hypothetical protein